MRSWPSRRSTTLAARGGSFGLWSVHCQSSTFTQLRHTILQEFDELLLRSGILAEDERVKRFAEGDRNLLQLGQELTPRHGLVSAADEYGHDRHRIVFQEHSYAGFERLQGS